MTKNLRTSVIVGVLAILCFVVSWWRPTTKAETENHGDEPVPASERVFFVLRLHPGDDLIDSIVEFSRKNSIEAGAVVTCVGSLDRARLRYANQSDYESLDAKGKHFEIVSLVGTLSTTGHHLHLAIANETGEVFGGHAGSGNKVYTTAEIVIADGLSWTFQRAPDPQTTYLELSPIERKHVAPENAR